MDYKAKSQELKKTLDELYTYSFRGQKILKYRADLERAFWGISRCGFSSKDMEGFIHKIRP
jgi:hypothetical protein